MYTSIGQIGVRRDYILLEACFGVEKGKELQLMNLIDLSGGTRIISYQECRELLRGEQVRRLAGVVEGRPEIFPVNYGMDGDGILFRSNSGRELSEALLRDVTLEVDRIDIESRSGWSVVIHGRAEDVSHFDGPGLEAKADIHGLGRRMRSCGSARSTPRGAA